MGAVAGVEVDDLAAVVRRLAGGYHRSAAVRRPGARLPAVTVGRGLAAPLADRQRVPEGVTSSGPPVARTALAEAAPRQPGRDARTPKAAP